jgi:hypothetical protein
MKSDINQNTLNKWQEEAIAAEIIENNIFGVDVNEESVDLQIELKQIFDALSFE